MTTATTEETKNVPQDVKEPVKDGADTIAETNNKQTENNDKKPAVAEKDDKVATPAAPVEPPQPKFTVKKQNFDKDVVYLYQFSRTPVIPSMSPYCLKVETWLRLAGLKYEASTRYTYLLIILCTSYYSMPRQCTTNFSRYHLAPPGVGFCPNGRVIFFFYYRYPCLLQVRYIHCFTRKLPIVEQLTDRPPFNSLSLLK